MVLLPLISGSFTGVPSPPPSDSMEDVDLLQLERLEEAARQRHVVQEEQELALAGCGNSPASGDE